MCVKPENRNARVAQFAIFANTGARQKFRQKDQKPKGHPDYHRTTGMFSPNRDEVRKFFATSWQKHCSRAPLTAMESLAADIILVHPEYQETLTTEEAAIQLEFPVENGSMNPFLHLSLHLALEEQLSIDQPPGLRAEFERIFARRGDRHTAAHAVLDCLGETVWRSQRDGTPPDALAYLECVRKR
jgi:hypothetical protein